MKNVAVIGVGAWGRNLARNFKELGALAAVCSEDLIIKGQTLWNDVPVCSFGEILENKTIKGVVIATPTPSHYELAKRLINSGKDVFIEKPLTETVKESEELNSLAKQKGRTVMVGHLLRYHPCYRRLLLEVQKGTIGTLLHISLRRCNFGKFRSYESVVRDLAPHDLSMLYGIFGNVENLECRGQNSGPCLMPNKDQVSLTLDIDQVSVDLFFSRVWPVKEQSLILQGSKGIIVFDDTKLWEEKLCIGLYKNIPFDGTTEPTLHMSPIDLPKEEPLKLECLHFLECLEEKAVCLTPGEEGALVLKWLEKIDI